MPPRDDPDLVQRGAFLFRDANLSGDGSRSCADCHPGGGADGKTWRDGEEVERGSPGARLTSPLRGVWQTAPYLWDGSIESLDEAIDSMLSVEMRGGAPRPRDLAALRAYVRSIPIFDKRRVHPDGLPTEPSTLSSRRGYDVFQEVRCDLCHAAPAYMRIGSSDVGTDGRWNIPSLRGVSAREVFGHDGRWSDLEEAVRAMLAARDKELSPAKLRQLLDYLSLL